MDDRTKQMQRKSGIVLEERSALTITGVVDVDSFNDESVLLDTELGALHVKGINLKINKLNIEQGELKIEGEIDGLLYHDGGARKSKGGGFFSLFK